MKWRRPVGLHSKMRQGRKGKPPQVNAGFGHAAATRGMVDGYMPVVVQNVADIARIDRERQAAVLASSLGLRAVAELVAKAEQHGVVILNKEKIRAAQHRSRVIAKQRAERAKAKVEEKIVTPAKAESTGKTQKDSSPPPSAAAR